MQFENLICRQFSVIKIFFSIGLKAEQISSFYLQC